MKNKVDTESLFMMVGILGFPLTIALGAETSWDTRRDGYCENK